MSVLVISLVVWLVLVFLSVTQGIEKNWIRKITSLHAPLRISPTEDYHSSYYYRIDSAASASNYTLKTIGEKAQSLVSDPYEKEIDSELPSFWPSPQRLSDGRLLDPVKELFSELSALQKETPDLFFQDYEISGALLRLSLHHSTSFLSQMSYLLSIPNQNPQLRSLLIPPDNAPFDFDSPPSAPLSYAYFSQGKLHLPDFGADIPVFLPKSYRDSGAQVGDGGTLSYLAPTLTSSAEQRIPIRVAGFYDSGILAVGNKCLLVPQEVTRSIFAAAQTFSPDGTPTNGVFVWIGDVAKAKEIQAKIKERLEKAGIASYWKVATYEEFEFAKDLLFQFQSDRNLLLLVAAIILVVACSNIISLLVLLVNDKKKEIAILQSMGASFRSIAAIFGFCGAFLGVVSSLLGGALALFTLHHLDGLISLLSALQGRTPFHPSFFGSSLPNQLSREALFFALIATPLISLAAGLIPALKASRIRPSSALRSE